MTFDLPHRKPRNPLVALAHRRLAGRHQTGRKAQRQSQQLTLRRELAHAEPDRHRP
jgi:hypothetical protein